MTKSEKQMAAITKYEWVSRAKTRLIEQTGDDWNPEALEGYLDALWESTLEDQIFYDYANDPEGAVDEDLTYWD